MNNQMMQMLSQLKSNPAQFLLQRRFNVPSNMMNDPNAIVSYLLKTGQVSQDAVNRCYQQMNMFR